MTPREQKAHHTIFTVQGNSDGSQSEPEVDSVSGYGQRRWPRGQPPHPAMSQVWPRKDQM
jgi:hypothetical protein